MSDPNLLGRHFKNPKDWAAWRSFLASLFGLPLSPDQLATFQQCTGRNNPPPGGTNEAWLVVGRRGGKSFILATIAVFDPITGAEHGARIFVAALGASNYKLNDIDPGSPTCSHGCRITRQNGSTSSCPGLESSGPRRRSLTRNICGDPAFPAAFTGRIRIDRSADGCSDARLY